MFFTYLCKDITLSIFLNSECVHRLPGRTSTQLHAVKPSFLLIKINIVKYLQLKTLGKKNPLWMALKFMLGRVYVHNCEVIMLFYLGSGEGHWVRGQIGCRKLKKFCMLFGSVPREILNFRNYGIINYFNVLMQIEKIERLLKKISLDCFIWIN